MGRGLLQLERTTEKVADGGLATVNHARGAARRAMASGPAFSLTRQFLCHSINATIFSYARQHSESCARIAAVITVFIRTRIPELFSRRAKRARDGPRSSFSQATRPGVSTSISVRPVRTGGRPAAGVRAAWRSPDSMQRAGRQRTREGACCAAPGAPKIIPRDMSVPQKADRLVDERWFGCATGRPEPANGA